jgi:hypothetical protein
MKRKSKKTTFQKKILGDGAVVNDLQPLNIVYDPETGAEYLAPNLYFSSTAFSDFSEKDWISLIAEVLNSEIFQAHFPTVKSNDFVGIEKKLSDLTENLSDPEKLKLKLLRSQVYNENANDQFLQQSLGTKINLPVIFEKLKTEFMNYKKGDVTKMNETVFEQFKNEYIEDTLNTYERKFSKKIKSNNGLNLENIRKIIGIIFDLIVKDSSMRKEFGIKEIILRHQVYREDKGKGKGEDDSDMDDESGAIRGDADDRASRVGSSDGKRRRSRKSRKSDGKRRRSRKSRKSDGKRRRSRKSRKSDGKRRRSRKSRKSDGKRRRSRKSRKSDGKRRKSRKSRKSDGKRRRSRKSRRSDDGKRRKSRKSRRSDDGKRRKSRKSRKSDGKRRKSRKSRKSDGKRRKSRKSHRKH